MILAADGLPGLDDRARDPGRRHAGRRKRECSELLPRSGHRRGDAADRPSPARSPGRHPARCADLRYRPRRVWPCCSSDWRPTGWRAPLPRSLSRSTSSSTRWCSSAALPQNIVWGGAAGCMPVLIGWAAVTGSLAWPPVILFGVVFFWTPPHFWALAMRFRDGLRARRRADAAGGRGAGASGSRHLVLLGADRRDVAGCSGRSPPAGSTACLRRRRRGAARRGAPSATRDVAGRRGGRPMRLFHLSNSYLAFVFVAVAVDTFLH